MELAETGERGSNRTLLRSRVIHVSLAGSFLVVLPWMDFGASRFLPVLQALLPVLCLVALASCLLLLSRRAWIPAAVLLLCLALSLAPTLPPTTAAACGTGSQITVLSLNAGRGHADPAGLAREIVKANPDILVLVEASEPMIDALAADLPDWDHTNRTAPVTTGGTVDTVLFSRYPLYSEAPAALQSTGALFDVPVVVVEHPQAGRIRVAGIHPVPPTHGPASWEDTLNVLGDWTEQRQDLPLVLAGDFNGTRAHPQLRALADGFDEAPPSIGPLPAGTWPANSVVPAFAAIDHVLVRGLAARSSERFLVDGTDHFGIVAHLGTCG